MANSWLRLWHDMPNDPKWRTIARVSKQSIPAVLSVYVHLLVIASNATERGRTQNVCSEDLASALDLDAEQVDAILEAMQGRVLDGDMVSGWAKRQVEREDGSAERAKRWREAQKEVKQAQPNAAERKQTPDTDTDTDTEKEKNKIKNTAQKTRAADFDAHGELVLLGVTETVAADFLAIRKRKRAPLTATALGDIKREAVKAGVSVNSALEKCCARGWQGFEASWLREANPAGKNVTQFLTAQQQRDENNRRSTAEFLADDTPFFGQHTETIEGEFTNA